MTDSLNKYISIGLIAARSNLAYLTEVIIRTFFLGVILYIFLQLWQLTYANAGVERVGDLSLNQMLWYLTITESIVLSSPRIAQEVDQDVRTGALATQLIKPMSYPLYRLWFTLGERIIRFGVNAIVGALIIFILAGPIHLSLIGILMFLIVLFLSFTLDFLGVFIIGIGSFWTEDTTGLVLIYSRLNMILGGMLIPIEIFPDTIQPVLKFLPFANIVYGPARMLVQSSFSFFEELLLRQALSILMLAICLYFVYNKAVNRIHLNGG